MAAAYAKMTGGLGVVIATSGPGATNLTTGLMEALLDQVSLLAITGMKPTAQLGYAEFQDVNQSRLFAGAGIEWSKDAASPEAVIPLLRDAVATALTRRTCAHLAIPVDIQCASSPLPLKHFCASHAALQIRPPAIDTLQLDATAASLVGAPDARKPRTIIAVGLRAAYGGPGMSDAILELAEALNAPVLTRLHAKGVVDESHPLSMGVIGVHGKPGLEAAALLVSSSDCVISIGVEDESLLVCNLAGLQIRKVIEIEPDAMACSTRFQADHTIVGDIEKICRQLASQIEILQIKVDKKRSIQQTMQLDESKMMEKFSYMMHNNPTAVEIGTHKKQLSLSRIVSDGIKSVVKDADTLWKAIHEGEWRKIQDYSDHTRVVDNEKDKISEGKDYCHPGVLLDALSRARKDKSTDAVSRNATIAVDVGDVTLWASLCLNLEAGSRTLYSERLGTMGYALNAGIASVLACPEPKGAVVLAGDGGFQMTLNELSTFQQHKRPGDKLLCIVLDNVVLGRVAFGFKSAKGCDLIGPDYVALAKAYGGDGVRLDKSCDAEQVVKMALEKEGLFLIHVIVDPNLQADMATVTDNSIALMNSG
eukprot:CAMPEP_0202498330 /NCGR_PEP_ID=MMETSP1361-20130828/25672_1 /ASSEMBLY_ACC=CAM_ASM_000849 /TAXON_ID=210615 /ORGANISM="Staurosira complex sp., Strain CCMP2646" /LENGTH=592 /DNA_ID=CAMNT_0049130183 /DNA_START=171 /DNA_END=1949 /DNA_ORIENTATION=+